MLLYILLILGQAFASQQITDRIYSCISKMATNTKNSANNFTVREVAEACRDQVGTNGIEVVEAKITEGTTHYIKFSWQNLGRKEFRHYAFNIPNTALCNEQKVAVKSLILSLHDIIDQDEKSFGYNACTDANEKYVLSMRTEKYGFGFQRKKLNGQCKRICPEGEVLKGTKANILYAHPEDEIKALHTSAYSKKSLGPVFLNVECVKCPKDGPNKDASYNKTNPINNLCYNDDGCEQGYELASKSHEPANSKPSIKNVKKLCIPKCSAKESRNADGRCVSDKKKRCEESKRIAKNPQRWLNRFLAASKSQTFGSCDIELVRLLAQEFVLENIAYLNNAVDSNCYDKPIDYNLRELNPKFSEYLIQQKPEISSCLLSSKQKNPKFDLAFYNLLSENTFTQDPMLNFYGY